MIPAAFHEEWFNEASSEAVGDLVRRVANIPGRIIEIGAWEGRSTVAIANAAHPRIVDTCDTWNGDNHPISEAIAAERDVFAQWSANVAEWTPGNVRPHRMDWREFVDTIDEPVAFCFIDAGHSYREVWDNLCAIIPKLAPNAILCGDDMHHGPVQDAVFEMFGTEKVYGIASLWVWEMPDNQADMDVARLRAMDRQLSPTDNEWLCDLDRVARIWRSYVHEVSAHDMAASPGTVAYLYRLCDYLKPLSILDLGSGLSSAVFRKWATERGVDCDIVSLDDDAEWLDKTSEFIRLNELPTNGLYLLDDWISVKHDQFDLVFHDFAGGATRNKVAELAAKAVKPGGAIVFDDAHFEEHLLAFERVSAENGITLYSLAKWTYDAIDRYSLLGFKDKEPAAVPEGIALAESYARLCYTPSDINEHLPRLAWMAETFQPDHIVELGARTGVSTTAWLYGLQGTQGRLTSVDISPAPVIGDHANWTHIQGDDTEADILDAVDECDILFIDTSHHYDHTLWELRNWSAKVRPGGVIVCHDTELERPWDPPCPETDPDFPVRCAIERFCSETGNRWINFTGCWGLGVIEVGAPAPT